MNRRITCTVAVALLAGCAGTTESRTRNLFCVGFCSQQDNERVQTTPKEPPQPKEKSHETVSLR